MVRSRAARTDAKKQMYFERSVNLKKRILRCSILGVSLDLGALMIGGSFRTRETFARALVYPAAVSALQPIPTVGQDSVQEDGIAGVMYDVELALRAVVLLGLAYFLGEQKREERPLPVVSHRPMEHVKLCPPVGLDFHEHLASAGDDLGAVLAAVFVDGSPDALPVAESHDDDWSGLSLAALARDL